MTDGQDRHPQKRSRGADRDHLLTRPSGRLALHGLTAISPPAPDRALVDQVIFDELTQYCFTDASRTEYARIACDLAEAGADAVVLGCTEIILLLDQQTVPEVPLLDTTTLHVEAIVSRALDGGSA